MGGTQREKESQADSVECGTRCSIQSIKQWPEQNQEFDAQQTRPPRCPLGEHFGQASSHFTLMVPYLKGIPSSMTCPSLSGLLWRCCRVPHQGEALSCMDVQPIDGEGHWTNASPDTPWSDHSERHSRESSQNLLWLGCSCPRWDQLNNIPFIFFSFHFNVFYLSLLYTTTFQKTT